MKSLRFGVAAVLCALLSICSSAQDKSFRQITGQNPNSTEFRVRYKLAQRNNQQFLSKLTLPSPSADLPAGTDWATSLGFDNPQLLDQFPSTWGLTNLNNEAPNCTTNYAEFNSNATPSATQANVMIYNELFRGTGGLCGTGNPTVYAAYHLGTTQLNGSSAAWSFEGATKGTSFAILERQKALLHIVTLTSGGSLTAPIAPTEVTIDFTNITNTHCTAGTVHTADYSDVFIDYATDEAYVGDDAGKLYHITGIFNGTQTMDFCASVNGGAYMQFPVHINISGTDYVFAMTNGKRLVRTQVNAARTGFSNTTSLVLSSIIGGFAGSGIYDTGASGTGVEFYGLTNHDIAGTQASLYQVNALNTPMTVDAELNLGPVVTPSSGTFNGLYLWTGFDNNFETNGAGGANATGYVCVYPSGATGAPGLASYQFTSAGIISGFTGMTNDTHINGATGTTGNICTDTVEVYDPIAAVDQLFIPTGNGTTTNTNKLSRFDITTPLTSNTTLPTASVATVDGGSSAIVIDYNDSGLGGQTQNIYFTELAVPAANRCGGTSPNWNSCAVKLQQSGLN